jgi:hypothetical protein
MIQRIVLAILLLGGVVGAVGAVSVQPASANCGHTHTS